MTSDAKVGVLLGFVFIFIIAFLINGLGDIKSDPDNNELTRQMINSYRPSPGLGGVERKVSQKVIEPIEPAQTDVVEIWENSSQEADRVRYTTELPEPVKPQQETGQAFDEQIKHEVMKAQVQTTVAQQKPQQEKEEKVMTISPPKQRVYIVQAGDSLASIAKEVYGQEEGNRRVNVRRIFEANRERLTSPDEIYKGQKLLIPPLTDPGVGAQTRKTGGIFPESLVKVVKSIGLRHKEASVSKKEKQIRWYEVKEDDNLWRIAAKELGDGNRYPDIARLNADILSDEDSIIVGMRLRLPKR